MRPKRRVETSRACSCLLVLSPRGGSMTSSLARLAEALPDTRGGAPGGVGGLPRSFSEGSPSRHAHTAPPGAGLPRANSGGPQMSGGGGGGGGPVREHRLQSEWAFHYMRRQGTGPRTESYEQSIKLLGAPFSTVEGFWQHHQWIKRPNGEEHERLPNSTDLHIFRAGIKPMWEDERNRYGGKFVVRVRKGLAARYWEDVCCAIVGEQFGVGDEICGAVLSLRFQEDIISIWNRTATNHEANERIREVLRRVLNLGPQGVGEYKPHQQSLGKQGAGGAGAGAGAAAGGFQSGGGVPMGGGGGGGFGQPGLRSPPGGGLAGGSVPPMGGMPQGLGR